MATYIQIRQARRHIESQKLAESMAKTMYGREKVNMQLLAIYNNLTATEIVQRKVE